MFKWKMLLHALSRSAALFVRLRSTVFLLLAFLNQLSLYIVICIKPFSHVLHKKENFFNHTRFTSISILRSSKHNNNSLLCFLLMSCGSCSRFRSCFICPILKKGFCLWGEELKLILLSLLKKQQNIKVILVLRKTFSGIEVPVSTKNSGTSTSKDYLWD